MNIPYCRYVQHADRSLRHRPVPDVRHCREYAGSGMVEFYR